MIVTLISWCYIAFTSFLCGFAALHVTFGRKRPGFLSPDLYLMSGLMVLTVYSQLFSLFYKVGLAATVVLGLASVAVLVLLRKPLWKYIRGLAGKFTRPAFSVTFILITGIVLILTVRIIMHYDTDLYHAQAIRWIEEYGVVKGLGHVHNRLAYNSSFFCLQALFSLKFALGRSLHTLNGFITAVMLYYAVSTQHFLRKEKTVTSDLLKLGFLYLFVYSEFKYFLSSPNSDILSLSLVLYVSSKWAEYMEKDRESSDDTVTDLGLLCLLSVWAVSVKLSAASLVLLTIYPAVLLIRRKRYKTIACFIGAGLLILTPFLARNVIISGYLVYPYSSIDLFDVDWKLNSYTPVDDSQEIKAWGRAMTDRQNYDAPFSQWFPVWYERLGTLYRVMFCLSILCLPAAVLYTVLVLRRKGDYKRLTLLLVSGAGLVMWFCSSPLPRYGWVYMFLMPAIFIGTALEHLKARTIPIGSLGCAAILGICLISYGKFAVSGGRSPLGWPEDYMVREALEYQLDGITIYLPASGDLLGYHYFPEVITHSQLELIELRTGRLEDGFRLKEEYRERKIGTTGTLFD